jgi:hypothetical protein
MQLYGITITNAIGNAIPSDGFIDPTTTEAYYGANATYNGLESVNPGSTLITTTGKRRGNLRFQHLLQTVQLLGNCYVVPNSIVTNATAITEGSALSFQLIVEHADSLQTADETAPGITLFGSLALIRALARGLSTPYVTATYVFDPTWTSTVGEIWSLNPTHVPRFGDLIDGSGSFIVGPYAISLAAAIGCIAAVPLLPVPSAAPPSPQQVWLNS